MEDTARVRISACHAPARITAAVAGDAWTVGSVQTVTWETKDIPPEVMNETGLILLGYIEEGSTNEHLDIRA